MKKSLSYISENLLLRLDKYKTYLKIFGKTFIIKSFSSDPGGIIEYSIMRHRLSSLWINALNTSSFITLLIRIEKKFFKVGNENHLSILSTVGSISKGNLKPINIFVLEIDF